MKCGYCNGTGEHINDANRMTTCEFCGGTGVTEPLTNEEYIRSCSTEELVEELSALIGWSITDYWMQKYEVETREDAVRMWLKEKKHDD